MLFYNPSLLGDFERIEKKKLPNLYVIHAHEKIIHICDEIEKKTN